MSPSLSATAARRICGATSGGEISPAIEGSVEHIVRIIKERTITHEFIGVPMDGSIGCFEALRNALWFKSMLTR